MSDSKYNPKRFSSVWERTHSHRQMRRRIKVLSHKLLKFDEYYDHHLIVSEKYRTKLFQDRYW